MDKHFKGNLEQNLFRSGYNAVRRHDLAENPVTTPSISLTAVNHELAAQESIQ
jgi:hypothetical protein